MAARYSVYVALLVFVLVIICSRRSHGFPTNNEVEGDMDDAGMLNSGEGERKQLLTGTSRNSEIVMKPEDKTSNQNKFKTKFVISPLSNLSNINWFTDYTKDYNNRQLILANYPRLEHSIFTDTDKTWNVNVLIETLELYQYRVQPCSSDLTSENKTTENSENYFDLSFTLDNDLGEGDNRHNFTVDHELYTEGMPEQPLKGIPDKILNKMLALSNETQSVDRNNTFVRESNSNSSNIEPFQFLNSTQIKILNGTNSDLDLHFIANQNRKLESIQLENRTQTEINEQFESGTETRTDSIILPYMETNAASQLQTICNIQNKNFNNLNQNDAKIKSALLTLNKQQIQLNLNVNQHINYTNIFSEYDSAFKELTHSNQHTLDNQIEVLVTKLQDVITHINQQELNAQHYRGYVQDRIAAVEAKLQEGKGAAEATAKSVHTAHSEDYRVTSEYTIDKLR